MLLKTLKTYLLPLLIVLCLIFPQRIFSQTKQHKISFIQKAPVIDGLLEDPCWPECTAITDFTQYVPVYNVSPTQKTEVKIAYDNNAIYVAAMMFDSAPDSIALQLGNRDDDVSADKFGIEFDTYNLQNDAYAFVVSASGVQNDYRINDYTYNAVWSSSVKIRKDGWSCELKIPYSALRFPNTKVQEWGMQTFRVIRRKRELVEWSLEKKDASNNLVNWGKLTGINDIKAPLRLSLTPFLSVSAEHFPNETAGKSDFSYSFSGGLDLKYGINDSYTLDVTLLPDFSQVQSDYQYKNISAFETVYDDNRPFFNEAIDLFKTGNLFYTRRIGRTPQLYNSVEDNLETGDQVIKNPSQAKLLNAIKLSGRSKNGLAIGFFNAITNNMFAEIKDSTGSSRKILTEPLTNYNILVLDQALKNSSKIYFVNSNVIRSKKFDDSNISVLGFVLNNKKNSYSLTGQFGLCQQFSKIFNESNKFKNTLGYKYSVGFAKTSGNFRFNLYRNELNDSYDANDLGLTLQNNQTVTGLNLAYNIYEPFWKFRDMENRLEISYRENFLTKYREDFNISFTNVFTTLKYFTVWEGFQLSPFRNSNFVETRTSGRYFTTDKSYYVFLGFSSDYRKPFALDGSFDYWQEIGGDAYYSSYTLTPIYRINDHLKIWLMGKYEDNTNDVGYVDTDDMDNIIFGKRDITNVESQINLKYIIKNNLSLSLGIRHYWSKGRYSEVYKLADNGDLITDNGLQTQDDYNFNFNSLNIDLLFLWEFAPGSTLNVAYKNKIISDEQEVVPSYFRNVKDVFDNPQTNSLSLKVIYYLDYQYLKKLRKHKNQHD